jgi:hypothetical protein
MQITFRLTPEDLLESQQGYHRALRSLAEKYMYAFSVFVWSLVFLDGAFLVYRKVSRGQALGGTLQTSWMMMVVSLLLIAVSLLNLRRGPWGNFKAPGYLGDQTLEIAEEGISIHAPERLTRQLGWAEVSRYTETRTCSSYCHLRRPMFRRFLPVRSASADSCTPFPNELLPPERQKSFAICCA